jgi:hypothetical protein
MSKVLGQKQNSSQLGDIGYDNVLPGQGLSHTSGVVIGKYNWVLEWGSAWENWRKCEENLPQCQFIHRDPTQGSAVRSQTLINSAIMQLFIALFRHVIYECGDVLSISQIRFITSMYKYMCVVNTRFYVLSVVDWGHEHGTPTFLFSFHFQGLRMWNTIAKKFLYNSLQKWTSGMKHQSAVFNAFATAGAYISHQ